MAILLTGCLILQPVTGAGAAVWGADFSSGIESDAPVPEENGEAAGPMDQAADFGDVSAPDAGAAETIPSPEVPGEVPPEVTPQENPEEVVVPEEIPPTETPGEAVVPEEIPPEETPAPGNEELFGDEEAEISGEGELFSESTGTGSIEVKVISMLPFEYVDQDGDAINVTVSIGSGHTPKILRVSGKTATAVADFDDLPAGNYTVTISAAKFADYTQEITVAQNTTHKIEVASARMNTGTNANPGWIRLGDVNGDKAINNNDITKMLDVIRSGEFDASANLTMGVNTPDGMDFTEEVDLSDLQYLVQSINENQISTIAESFVPSKEMVTVPETTHIAGGTVEGVLKGEESLTLQPAKDEVISESNPVEIGFALAAENAAPEDVPKIEGITIETPVAVDEVGNLTSDISSGYIEYTYVNSAGEDAVGRISIGDTQSEGSGGSAEQLTGPASVDLFTGSPAEDSAAEESAGEADLSEETVPADSVVQNEVIGEEPVTGETGEETENPDDAAELFDAPEAEEDMISAPVFAFMASVLLPQTTVYADQKPSVKVDADGSLVVDFGTQVAVKKVSITITGTKKNQKLADIAKVEFVNDMDKRIPAPELNIPKFDMDAISKSINNEEFTIHWKAESNVTGYDLFISGPVKKENGVQTQIVRVQESPHLVTMINDKPIVNFKGYTVKIRSVNGDWTSPWSEAITVTPAPTSKPAAPDNVAAKGAYRAVNVTWKMMDDAEGYMLYYREATPEDEGTAPPADDSFMPVVEGFQMLDTDTRTDKGETVNEQLVSRGMLTSNSYTISKLKDGVSYYIYVIGWNSLGWGVPSGTQEATTTSGEIPRLPEYQLINKSTAKGEVSEHILQALHGNHGGASMQNSPIDEANEGTSTQVQHTHWAYGVVDNNYDSYWLKHDEWDDGISYFDNNFARGITVTLDKEYEMSYLTFTDANLQGEPSLVRIHYWNKEHGDERQEVKADLIRRTDDNNHPYFIAKFHQPVKAQRILMCLGTGYSRIEMKVGEMHFHKYSDIEGKIYALYADEMHSQLVKGVTREQIEQLRAELNVPDQESGELHPLHDYLDLELTNAEDILAMGTTETYKVETGITARKDGTLNYGGLNAWQPLGRSVYAGEELIVFVGHNFKKIGDNADLNIVFTQYHAESNALSSTRSLKVGRNVITVPSWVSATYEKGGQVYVEYTGNNSEDQYGVRISGGVKIPVLNIYKKTGQEKKDAISKYITELEAYVGTIQKNHDEIHRNKSSVNYDYNERLCILNATDLMMEHMMYSVPATQVLEGLKDDADKAAALETALDAMEQTMVLFYQHKGLTNMDGNTKYGSNNRLSARHLNIRYMRMFAGAFMYASGNHIGIEFPETVIASGAGSWDSFGWGIAHEIGHDINDGKYAIAEITNNYFAQLLTRASNGLRFKWPDVYEKVTSGEIGRSSNGAVQLALYWQLHLAFDSNADRNIFTTYDDMFNNLFFARVDTYSRNPDKAPKSLTVVRNGKDVNLLSQNDGVDQNLMRLSCAAANANILPFFERWGMVPDEDTRAYANLYGEPTEKALYYVNENARGGMHGGTGIKGQDVVKASVTAENQYATLTLQTTASVDNILGYEIIRGTYTDGVLSKEVVGFTECTGETTTYVDKVSTMNNRVMYYEVKAVDKSLNYSNSASAGSVKIETGGALNKENWTVETSNMVSQEDLVPIQPDKDDPDMGYNLQQAGGVVQKYPHTIDRIIDGNPDMVYTGTASAEASIVIDMKTVKEVTSIKYKGSPLSSVIVSVGNVVTAEDGTVSYDWKVVKSGSCGSDETLWFDPVDPENQGKWIGTYDAQLIGIAVPEGEISIKEIEVCGPSGDNMEFFTAEESSIPAVGILTDDYKYAEGDGHVIPANSLVFVGKYKGNPAYNVVVLFDENGDVIGQKDGNVNAEQVILAEVPAQGDLGETADGRWVYYVTPENLDMGVIRQIGKVRGELYRVDDAHTMKGERVVSDTVFLDMPDVLPSITLTGGSIPGAAD